MNPGPTDSTLSTRCIGIRPARAGMNRQAVTDDVIVSREIRPARAGMNPRTEASLTGVVPGRSAPPVRG